MASRSSAAPVVHRFTRDEYHRMAKVRLFQDARVELLDGEIITMSAQLSPHAFVVNQLMYLLIAQLGSSAIVRVQAPIVLNNLSEPEPDLAVCLPVPDRYSREHPQANQVLIVIEVAESSLRYDRTRKVRAYAASGIAEYWIVNLVDRRIEKLTDPTPKGRNYKHQQYVAEGERLSLPTGGSIAVADILP